MEPGVIALQVLVKAISNKLPMWAALLSTVGLFTFNAISPELWRFITACSFAVGVFLPILYYSNKSE